MTSPGWGRNRNVPKKTSNKTARSARRYAGAAATAIVLAAALWQQGGVMARSDANAAGAYEFQLSGKVVQVADGDTFTLLVDRRRERIRMASIDAPETTKDSDRPGQPMAQASRKALAGLIAGRQLTVLCYERDRYERSICDVPLEDGTTANQRQVMRGMAWANMEGRGKFMRDPSLPGFEDKARRARTGLWSQAGQVPPWVWRYQCWKQGQC